MVKILSTAGISLADVYDVEGSVAGVEQLRSEEVGLTHEMGGTIFSERVQTTIRRATTGAILQNATWDIVLDDLPDHIVRVLGCVIFANTVVGRVSHCNVSLLDPDDEREIPVWAFDAAFDDEIVCRLVNDGAAVANLILLRPVTMLPNLPSLLMGLSQSQRVSGVTFRGLTSGFGAGNVTITMELMIAFTHIGVSGISSFGLPIPSW